MSEESMQSERLGESCSVDTFPHEEFSVLVKHYRCARGLTQEELAERAKISVDSISNIERGLLHTPRSSTLQQLALALTLAPHERDDFLSAAHRAKAASRKARLLRTARHASETASSLIPLPPAPLVGRHQDLKSARAILSDPRVRLLTITGVGGVGKTQFAFELAREMGTTVTEGVHIVYLAPIHDPALVQPAIAEVLGLHETGATSIAQSWFSTYVRRMLFSCSTTLSMFSPLRPPSQTSWRSPPISRFWRPAARRSICAVSTTMVCCRWRYPRQHTSPPTKGS